MQFIKKHREEQQSSPNLGLVETGAEFYDIENRLNQEYEELDNDRIV
jgi:hypothetical protein